MHSCIHTYIYTYIQTQFVLPATSSGELTCSYCYGFESPSIGIILNYIAPLRWMEAYASVVSNEKLSFLNARSHITVFVYVYGCTEISLKTFNSPYLTNLKVSNYSRAKMTRNT